MRGHHLICLNFLRPETLGASYASIAPKVKEIQARLEGGETAAVVKGADDVCESCEYLKGGVCEYESEVSEMDEGALEALGLKVGQEVRWDEVREAVSSIADWWKAEYCEECELKGACFG